MSRELPSARRTGRRPRRIVRLALLAVLTVVGVAAAPGIASAAAPTVTPLLDCFVRNTDGSVTVVLGYTSTYPNQVSIPLTNKKNYASPASFSSQFPTRFQAGTHHGVVTLRLSPTDLAALSWYLDGRTLDFAAATAGSSACSPQQLPALANGAAMALGVCLAGVAGVVLAWRARRRWAAARPVQPGDEGPRHA
jgi:hypothetical protein